MISISRVETDLDNWNTVKIGSLLLRLLYVMLSQFLVANKYMSTQAVNLDSDRPIPPKPHWAPRSPGFITAVPTLRLRNLAQRVSKVVLSMVATDSIKFAPMLQTKFREMDSFPGSPQDSFQHGRIPDHTSPMPVSSLLKVELSSKLFNPFTFI
jgi:hypothetical protein